MPLKLLLSESGEIVQKQKVFTALPEGLSSFPLPTLGNLRLPMALVPGYLASVCKHIQMVFMRAINKKIKADL